MSYKRLTTVVLLLVFTGLLAAAAPGPKQLDSLYTYAYLKHRVYRCTKEFHIPHAELRRLQAAAAIADSLVRREPGAFSGRYAYLPFWVAHPEMDEDSAMALFRLIRPAPATCKGDTSGYVAAQQQITYRRLASFQKQQNGDTLAAINYLDSIVQHIPFSAGDLYRAKRLAIATRDTASYLRLLRHDTYTPFSERLKKETGWSMIKSPEQMQFVHACFRLADSSTMPTLRQEASEVRLCINRFADLQSIVSDCIFTGGLLRSVLRSDKQALRRIYCYLVEETYSVVPVVFCRYAAYRDSISPASISTLGYLSLHLMQLNAFGRIYPAALFENYFRFLRELVYRQRYDMETYVSFYDEYLTAILGMPSEYGYTARKKGLELKYGTAPSTAVEARRKAAHLLPLDIASRN